MEMKAPKTTAQPHPPSGGVTAGGPPTAGGIFNGVKWIPYCRQPKKKKRQIINAHSETWIFTYSQPIARDKGSMTNSNQLFPVV